MSFIFSQYWWSTSGIVLVPLIVTSVICLIVNKTHLDKKFITFTGVSFLLTFLSGRWEVTEESQSLFLIPFFIVFLAFLLFLEKDAYFLIKKAPLAFSGCFLSLLAADILHAAMYFPVIEDPSYLRGIAGAGMYDGLFVFPFASFFLTHYAVFRKTKSIKK